MDNGWRRGGATVGAVADAHAPPTGGRAFAAPGADNVVLDRVGPGQVAQKAVTSDHLAAFSRDGLRTLCYAVRELDNEYSQHWVQSAEEGSQSRLGARVRVRSDRAERSCWRVRTWPCVVAQLTCWCRCTATYSWHASTTRWRPS